VGYFSHLGADVFTTTDFRDVMCGMLHCKHLNERLEFGMESVAILSQTFLNTGGDIIACRNAIVDLGLNEVDPGLAPDGSKCGEGKVKIKLSCSKIDAELMFLDVCEPKVHGGRLAEDVVLRKQLQRPRRLQQLGPVPLRSRLRSSRLRFGRFWRQSPKWTSLRS